MTGLAVDEVLTVTRVVDEVVGFGATVVVAAGRLYLLAKFLHQSLIIQISKSVIVSEEPANMMKFVMPVGVQS